MISSNVNSHNSIMYSQNLINDQLHSLKNLTIHKPPYYHREFENDINIKPTSAFTNQIKRITLVTLPFISLYEPLGKILSFTMDSARCYTFISKVDFRADKKELAFAMFNTALAVTALAYSFFEDPTGLLITTVHDLVLNVGTLMEAINSHDSKTALEVTAQIVNNLLYLALFSTGSLEILVLSMATQILLKGYRSLDEFKKDNYLEAIGHLLMSGIKSNQLAPHIQELKLKYPMLNG